MYARMRRGDTMAIRGCRTVIAYDGNRVVIMQGYVRGL